MFQLKKIVSLAKEYYHFVIIAALAVLSARALHYRVPAGEDIMLAVKATEGFFSAIAYGARHLGDGIVGSFLRVSLCAMPVVIWKALCTAALLFSDVAAALIVCRKLPAGDESERKIRLAASLAFSSVMFALIPLAVLRESVLSIAGTVHFVIPGALVLALYLLFDRAADKGRGAWYLALVSLAAALLSWQAALCAVVICAWYVVGAAKKGAFRLSYAFALASPAVVFIAHYKLQNAPRFPEVSRLFALRSFFAAAFDESGFFAVLAALSILVCARTLCRRVVPSLRSKEKQSVGVIFYFALCLMSAVNAFVLVLHSTLVPSVAVSGVLTVLTNVITLALTFVDFILDLRRGKGAAKPIFALCAFVAAAATLATYTFGGGEFYLPIVLSLVVLIAEFADTRSLRAATTTLCAVCAYFAATLCLTGGKVIIAAAIALVCFIVELLPTFRRPRLTESLAVFLVMLTLFGVGSDLAAYADVASENERRVNEFKADPTAFLVLKGGAQDKAYLPYYRKYYGIGDDVLLYFAAPGEKRVPDDLGDLNGDGKVNSLDRLLFMKALEE